MQRIFSVGGGRQVQRFALVLALVLLGSQVGTRRAVAQGAGSSPVAPETSEADSRRAAARTKLVEGDGLLKQGAYQDALAAFKDAFALFPSPKIHYNFGLALKGMGRNAEALEAFDRFLAQANDATPDTRARALASREELLARVGAVKVAAAISGASILVDGREVGRTPYPNDIHLDPGPHMLTVDRGGGALPFTQRLDVRAGAVLSVMARFPDAAVPPPEPAGNERATPVVAPPPSVGAASDAPGERSRSWVRPVAWTSAGLGAAALVTGVVGWAVKESKFKKFNGDPACDKAFPNDGGAGCHDLVESGETGRTVGIVSFVAAGVFGIASAVAFVADRRGGDDAAAGTVSFQCGVGWGAAACAGRF